MRTGILIQFTKKDYTHNNFESFLTNLALHKYTESNLLKKASPDFLLGIWTRIFREETSTNRTAALRNLRRYLFGKVAPWLIKNTTITLPYSHLHNTKAIRSIATNISPKIDMNKYTNPISKKT